VNKNKWKHKKNIFSNNSIGDDGASKLGNDLSKIHALTNLNLNLK
jgi:hypothetical protein